VDLTIVIIIIYVAFAVYNARKRRTGASKPTEKPELPVAEERAPLQVKKKPVGEEIRPEAPAMKQAPPGRAQRPKRGRPLQLDPEAGGYSPLVSRLDEPFPVLKTEKALTPGLGGFETADAGPSRAESITIIGKPVKPASPIAAPVSDEKKGDFGLAEGMIWSQILGKPRSRQPYFQKAGVRSRH